MTQPPNSYTDLDLLKQMTAQGLISAAAIQKVLGRFKEQNPDSTNGDIDYALSHTSVIMAHLITAQTERVVHSDDPDHYSDGRPVKTKYEAGSQEFEHVWYADPDHPYNQPGATPAGLVMSSDGQLYSLSLRSRDR